MNKLSAYIANALRYWEPRRLIYNGVLALVVLAHVVYDWATWSQRLTLDVLLGGFLLAVLANIAYCAVYAVDLFVQYSGLDAAWRIGRPVLLTIGTLFAAALTHFFLLI
jgi:hypothetical protein